MSQFFEAAFECDFSCSPPFATRSYCGYGIATQTVPGFKLLPDNEHDNSFDRMVQNAQEAAKKLNLPPDFLFEILKDSDWGFVIKLNALFESALEEVNYQNCFASAYARRRDEDKLRKFCRSLNPNGRAGKIELASIFGLLSPETKAYLTALTELRNKFAHGVAGASLTIEAVANEEEDKHRFYKRFAPFLVDPNWANVSPEQMRFYFVLSAMLRLWELEFMSRPPPSFLGGFSTAGEDGPWWRGEANVKEDEEKQ